MIPQEESDMEKMKRLSALILAIALLAGSAALADTRETPEIILFTCYMNLLPDGLRLQAGCIDYAGGLWTLDLPDADLTGYSTIGEYLIMMRRAGKLKPAGQLEGDMFDLRGLVSCTENQGSEPEAVSEGAGGECSYAMQWNTDGSAEEILLGASGDSKFENTDPNAQALYLLLRKTFPEVENYAYTSAGPQGFQAVPLIEFCGWQEIDFSKVTIRCYLEDCEEGPIPAELTPDEAAEILRIATEWKVTGKANATVMTGGPVTFSFLSGDGTWLGSLSLYEGLLVRGDGMYYISE